jgi:hypothetical protein
VFYVGYSCVSLFFGLVSTVLNNFECCCFTYFGCNQLLILRFVLGLCEEKL